MVEMDNFLDKNLEHVGEALKQTPGADAVGADATLDEGANLAFIVDIEKRQQRIY